MIAIVDYGMGNLRSVAKACEAVGLAVTVTARAGDLFQADKIILPGVGAFGAAAEALARMGMDSALKDAAIRGTPILGICLGHQLLFDESEEDGIHQGLGLIAGRVEAIRPDGRKVPHMGWNGLNRTNMPCSLFQNLKDGENVYFVHSYAVLCDAEYVTATADYGGNVVAAVQKGNIFGLQFHPEKSGSAGLKILENFGNL